LPRPNVPTSSTTARPRPSRDRAAGTAGSGANVTARVTRSTKWSPGRAASCGGTTKSAAELPVRDPQDRPRDPRADLRQQLRDQRDVVRLAVRAVAHRQRQPGPQRHRDQRLGPEQRADVPARRPQAARGPLDLLAVEHDGLERVEAPGQQVGARHVDQLAEPGRAPGEQRAADRDRHVRQLAVEARLVDRHRAGPRGLDAPAVAAAAVLEQAVPHEPQEVGELQRVGVAAAAVPLVQRVERRGVEREVERRQGGGGQGQAARQLPAKRVVVVVVHARNPPWLNR
jgi:hypothetical protein